MLSLSIKSFQHFSTCFCFRIPCKRNLISSKESTRLLDLGNQTQFFLNLILWVSKNESFFGVILTKEYSFLSHWFVFFGFWLNLV
jgi:hypothetical protein